MTAYIYMQKQLRGIAGGIAWPQHVFTARRGVDPAELVDAAVDIVWERLRPKAPAHPDLEIEQRGNLIVFRIRKNTVDAVFGQAA